jgi:hypothetical protein
MLLSFILFPGNMEMWKVEMWKCGNVEIWKRGNMQIWKYGNIYMEIWKCGNMEICMEIWKWKIEMENGK